MREPLDPCDECGSAPAVINGLCGACWVRLFGHNERDDYDPDGDEATDDEVADAETEWENWRTKEPR
jgi:hypothetical protein